SFTSPTLATSALDAGTKRPARASKASSGRLTSRSSPRTLTGPRNRTREPSVHRISASRAVTSKVAPSPRARTWRRSIATEVTAPLPPPPGHPGRRRRGEAPSRIAGAHVDVDVHVARDQLGGEAKPEGPAPYAPQ